MKAIFSIFCFSTFLITSLFADSLPKIKIVTEYFPPYSYLQNKKVVGMATEVIQAVLSELNISADIEIKNWNDAYNEAKNQPNVLIYSIIQDKNRYDLFKWVGTIIPPSYEGLIGLEKNKKRISIKYLSDLKNFKIATVEKDNKETFLLSNGFQLNKELFSQKSQTEAINKLFSNEVDLVVFPISVAKFLAKEQNQNESQLKMYFPLTSTQSSGYFMAFGKKTDDNIVDQFRKALNKIKQSGVFNQIAEKYN